MNNEIEVLADANVIVREGSGDHRRKRTAEPHITAQRGRLPWDCSGVKTVDTDPAQSVSEFDK